MEFASADAAAEEPSVPCTDLIVLGLPYNSDERSLGEYFSSAGYGPLAMAEVKRSPNGCSRGFGFVRFRDWDSQARCLTDAYHQIDGRRCEVKIPKSQQQQQQQHQQHQLYDQRQQQQQSRRVFVGRITEDLTEPVLQEFFSSKLGLPVHEVYIPKPFRSFAFVTFAEASASTAALIGRDFLVNGVTIHVDSANPKQQQQQPQQQQPQQQYVYQEVANSLASNPQLLADALRHQSEQQQYQTPTNYLDQYSGPTVEHLYGYYQQQQLQQQMIYQQQQQQQQQQHYAYQQHWQ